MENLEEDLSDLQNSASPLEVETTVAHSSLDATLNDSVEIIETPIEVLDLTSPQPSTSSSSNSAGTATALVGATNSSSSCLVKRNLEEALKEERNTTDSTSLDQNPSTSNSSSAATTSSGSSSGNVLECPICLQTCIHPARLPCGHIFCFLCVKGVAYKNRRCAMCRREIPPEFLDHPQLVNGIEDICTTKATDDGYQWFYEGRNGWWQYDDRTSQDLEEAFKKGERSCTILVAGYVYIVDFDAMVQQRQNEPARCRRVKRDLATIPKKGVAGLRIEGNTVTTDSNFAAQVYQSRQNSRYRSGDLNEGDLESPGNFVLRNPADFSSPNPSLRYSYGGFGGYVIELGNASEFVSTAAATDAALRIASDIIGSTLAHADELTRSTGGSNSTTINNTTTNSYNPYNQPLAISHIPDTSMNSTTGELSLNDLTLNTQLTTSPVTTTAATVTTNAGSGSVSGTGSGGVGSLSGVSLTRERGSRELLGAAEDLLGATQRVIATADQPTIDLFEQTLNDFHTLTLRNIVDSSDDDNEQQQHQHQQHQHQHHHHHHQHQLHNNELESQQLTPTTATTSPPPTTTGQRSNPSSTSSHTQHSYNQENP